MFSIGICDKLNLKERVWCNMRCSSYCRAEGYNVDDLSKFLRDQGLDPKFYDDVIHVQKIQDSKETDIFIFPYGCLVFWDFDIEEEEYFLKQIADFQLKTIPSLIRDDATFLYGEETVINEENDEIVLQPDDVLIKLSISYGLSQSVKLSAFEESIDRTIEKTRYLPDELAKKGKISLSSKKISQKLGALFAQRNSINLHTEILDTPEFFWRRPKYEHYYAMASQYLDIAIRVDILNRRLDVIRELYEILSNELKHLHSSRLEITIIALIFIEIMLAVHHNILQWF